MKPGVIAFALAISFLPFSASLAITGGQLDDFEDGTTDNWANGGFATPPANVSSGGPAGTNDNFLQIAATGGGAGGRLTVFNRMQWLGDYIGAGVTAIELDLENLGDGNSPTLSIRLAFKTDTTISSSGYITTSAFSLAPNTGWQHAVFVISPGTMTAIGTPAAFNTFFSNPGELRIINEAGTTNLNGDPVTSQLGIDNIKAVPEPSVFALAALASLSICFRRARK